MPPRRRLFLHHARSISKVWVSPLRLKVLGIRGRKWPCVLFTLLISLSEQILLEEWLLAPFSFCSPWACGFLSQVIPGLVWAWELPLDTAGALQHPKALLCELLFLLHVYFITFGIAEWLLLFCVCFGSTVCMCYLVRSESTTLALTQGASNGVLRASFHSHRRETLAESQWR